MSLPKLLNFIDFKTIKESSDSKIISNLINLTIDQIEDIRNTFLSYDTDVNSNVDKLINLSRRISPSVIHLIWSGTKSYFSFKSRNF